MIFAPIDQNFEFYKVNTLFSTIFWWRAAGPCFFSSLLNKEKIIWNYFSMLIIFSIFLFEKNWNSYQIVSKSWYMPLVAYSPSVFILTRWTIVSCRTCLRFDAPRTVITAFAPCWYCWTIRTIVSLLTRNAMYRTIYWAISWNKGPKLITSEMCPYYLIWREHNWSHPLPHKDGRWKLFLLGALEHLIMPGYWAEIPILAH